jgi:hypothetical protein
MRISIISGISKRQLIPNNRTMGSVMIGRTNYKGIGDNTIPDYHKTPFKEAFDNGIDCPNVSICEFNNCCITAPLIPEINLVLGRSSTTVCIVEFRVELSK